MKLTRQDVPFTMVANAVLKRNDISFAVKGLFAYLFSKPSDWDFSAERIARIESKEERKTIQRLLRELEGAKLLTRQRQPTGKMEYRISFAEPEPVNDTAPLFVPTEMLAVARAKPNGFIGIFKGVLPDLSPIDGGKTLNEIIDLFQPLNPSYGRLFKNKSQRAAVQRLLMEHGEAKVRTMISEAVSCFGRAYCPTITTPVELELKLGQLVSAVKKAGQQKPSAPTVRIFNEGGRAIKKEFVVGQGWR